MFYVRTLQFSLCIRMFIYKFLNVCPFDYTAVAGSGKVWPVIQVNHTSWVAVVTHTERPKSVWNRWVIELFCGVVCVVTLPFWRFFWCRGFCHVVESGLVFFLSYYEKRLKASYNSAQVQHLYESFLLLKKSYFFWSTEVHFDSLLKHQFTKDNTFALIWSSGN